MGFGVCAVTYRIDDEATDDETGDTFDQETGRGPLFHIILGVMLACFGSGSALAARAYGMSFPTLPSFTSVASSPAPAAAKPVALSDFQALQQQLAASMQSTERLLAAQQAEIKRLSDQVVALSGKLDLLQRPLASAQGALPAAAPPPAPKPRPVTAAARPKKPAAVRSTDAISTGAVSTGGAPLPLTR